jgi:hypothetical protein
VSQQENALKITKAHLDYWRQRQCPVPGWAAAVAEKERPVSLDSLINGRQTKKEMRLDAHNMCVHLCLMRKRGANLREELARMAAAPGTIIRPRRRAGYARKWLAALAHQAQMDG